MVFNIKPKKVDIISFKENYLKLTEFVINELVNNIDIEYVNTDICNYVVGESTITIKEGDTYISVYVGDVKLLVYAIEPYYLSKGSYVPRNNLWIVRNVFEDTFGKKKSTKTVFKQFLAKLNFHINDEFDSIINNTVKTSLSVKKEILKKKEDIKALKEKIRLDAEIENDDFWDTVATIAAEKRDGVINSILEI